MTEQQTAAKHYAYDFSRIAHHSNFMWLAEQMIEASNKFACYLGQDSDETISTYVHGQGFYLTDIYGHAQAAHDYKRAQTDHAKLDPAEAEQHAISHMARKIMDDGAASVDVPRSLERAVCLQIQAYERSDREQEEYEGRCDGIASRREDHQRDE